MTELEDRFPEGLDYAIVYDTTPFIRESINEVFKTLRDAVFLVAVVVLLFLQNWRSAIIPLVAVPVAVVGTFAVMAAMGFSLNNLTLFGLVLAIGIVVDDAIVVVEAVEHHIEHGMSPRDATLRAMEQVSGPVIAVGLVLSAVFIPCAFISGITGQFFRQFALTIAVSTVISAFNSLTLSPALTALLLRPRDKGTVAAAAESWYFRSPAAGSVGRSCSCAWSRCSKRIGPPAARMLAERVVGLSARGRCRGDALVGWLVGAWLNRLLGWSFRAFNRGFDWATGIYTGIVGGLLRVSLIVLVFYGGCSY